VSPAPDTSVIIPVRNGVRFVVEAVESVLRQLGPDDEVLVIDDASRDGTADCLRHIADRRMIVLAAAGRGVSAARNLGLAAARSAFLAFLDHDDLWPTGRHHALSQALRDDPGLGVSFGRVRMRFEADVPSDRVAEHLDGLHIRELIGSALYRTELVRHIGGFAEDMSLREDADFTYRLFESGVRAALCEVDALIYRRHASNVTNDEAALNLALVEVARRRLARRRAQSDLPESDE
jgi:glycosyltransferase involved in cell wall biosynthesis